MSTTKDFEDELKRILRRASRIKAVLEGDASVSKVWRKPHSVRAHKVRGHFALIVKMKK